MFSLKFCTAIILVVAHTVTTVKVNMEGTLSMGQQILDSFAFMLKNSYLTQNQTNRRSGSGLIPQFIQMLSPVDTESERIKWTVDAEDYCKEVPFCEESQKKTFVIDYVTLLGNAVTSIFDSVLNKGVNNSQVLPPGSIFIENLKTVLSSVHRILNHAETHVTENREAHQWVSVIKRIAAKFQDQALLLVYRRLPGDSKDVHKVRKKLIQKLVVAVVIVENKYESKLCTDLRMCIRDHEVTKSLHKFLAHFKGATDSRCREFVKYFYESLPEDFFYFTDADTGHEFQVVLSEMSFVSSVPTQTILLSVLKTLEARKRLLKTHNETVKGYDSQLIHVILSDMDHFYYHANRKRFPFDTFMEIFSSWVRRGGRLGVHIRLLFKEIKKKLLTIPRDLFNKLGNEVRVFLELTVDPDDK